MSDPRAIIAIGGGHKDSSFGWDGPPGLWDGWIHAFPPMQEIYCLNEHQVELEVDGWTPKPQNSPVTVTIYRTKNGERGNAIIRLQRNRADLAEYPSLVWREFPSTSNEEHP